ncbi:MAG: S8 family serine peptidase, partial [Candidatus Marinimicrobia bacterium]|nr:S8 family serine peptidase [Candidatus Neomarinimicrobiota bacterium]
MQLINKRMVIVFNMIIILILSNTIIKAQLDPPDDPYFYLQLGLRQGDTGRDIQILGAWEYQTGRNDVIISVIDDGIEHSHEDLDPGDRSRIIIGRDIPQNNSSSSPDGSDAHGTQVAGIIGAIPNNQSGIAGILWDCQIMPVKAKIGVNYITTANITNGILWSYQHGADIINMSIGDYNPDWPTWWEEIIWGTTPLSGAVFNAYLADVSMFAAIMNDNIEDAYAYPASYNEVMGIGASDSYDSRATWPNGGSNYGVNLEVVAPGDKDYNYTTIRNDNYGSFGMTSSATAIASGVAGLILSEIRDNNLGFTNDDIRHILQLTADKVRLDLYNYSESGIYGWNEEVGFGRINAEKALEILNPPYEIEINTIYGGNNELVDDDHSMGFIDIPGLTTGNYHGVKTYRVYGHVDFTRDYDGTPYVWIRERESQGYVYSAGSLSQDYNWGRIYNLNDDGFDWETFIYYVGTNDLGQNVDIWVPTGVNGVDITYVINGVPLDPPHIARSNSYHKHCRFCQSHIHSKITISGFIPSIKNYFTIYRRINLGNWVNIATTSSTTYIDSWLEVNPRGSQRIDYQVTMTTFTPEESAPSNTVTTWFDYINKQLVEGDLPDEYELKTNHPNPFNPVTTIAFGLPVPSYVELKIYDFLGREVKILVNRN